MTMLADSLLRAGGVAVAVVFLLVFAMRGGWRRRGDLLAVVACGAAYLVCSSPQRPCCSEAATLPLLMGAIAFPFAFWRLARVVLEEEARIPPGAWLGLALLLAGGIAAAADYAGLPSSWRMAAAGLNKLAAVGFVGAALHVAWRSWEGDLVEPRRRFRWLLVAYLGTYGLVILASEIYLLGDRPPAALDLLNAALIDLTLVATLAYLVQPRETAMEALFGPGPGEVASSAKEPSPVRAADEPLLARIGELMEQQKLYRDPELSVPGLAARIGVSEYVLRRLIHDRLGHRNFAAFVNQYRLEEVAARLREPDLSRRPILTLALEAGFGSIGPFNRAFRERYGLAPSAFRDRRIAGERTTA